MRDDDLDHMLYDRAYEAPRQGFEQRILAHARATEQRPQARPVNWMRVMLSELLMPRMQLVYALVLTLGIALGLTTPVPTDTTPSSYLTEDGAVL